MLHYRFIAILCLKSAILTGQASEGQRARAVDIKLEPLPIEQALDWRTGYYTHAPLSADGQWVAYGVYSAKGRALYNGRVFDETGGGPFQATSEVWIGDLRTSRTQKLGNGSEPSWSPDGSTVAFFSSRDGGTRLWTWHRKTGQVRRLSAAIVRHYADHSEAIQWTPDGKHIVTKLLADDMTIEDAARYADSPVETAPPLAPGTTVTVYRPSLEQTDNAINQNHRRKQEVGDLALIELASGRVKRIARRVHSTRYRLSPDGKQIAWLDWDIRRWA